MNTFIGMRKVFRLNDVVFPKSKRRKMLDGRKVVLKAKKRVSA